MTKTKPKIKVVAYNGQPGAWSEAAALAAYGKDTETIPCDGQEAVFEAVENGTAERGILAIEHSLTGSDHRTYDRLLAHRLQIVGEVYFPIVHCLVAHPGARTTQIRRVYSHPRALEQCQGYLEGLGKVSLRPVTDTGAAVARIQKRGLMDAAAVASEQAAEAYGMKVLTRGIEDPPSNVTRFLLMGSEADTPTKKAKTSIVFAVKDLTRQFFSCYGLFALREIPLTKIESRPIKGRSNHFLFYLDAATSTADPDLEQAIEQLREVAPWVRVLGSYPQGKRVKKK